MQAILEKEKKKVLFEADPLFSAIVPVHNLPEPVFKRCLMSLWEQNYKNLEVILVFDGQSTVLEDIAAPYLERGSNWRKIVIPHKGACAARNAGFEVSTGEVVAFINSDYVLKRGIIKLWVDRLLEHKDCGFVYGGYEYNTRERGWYESTTFDPYHLEIENYIDCGFPLWRKYVVKWDENCKSLQDWDFWMRVVQTHKVKGYYLGRDVSYIAEPPRAGGLTADSSQNWIDRVKYIKEKNGIPLRDILVMSIGARSHALNIAKMIDADYKSESLLKPNEYKAVYLIGFYMKPGEMGNQHGPLLSSFKPEVKKIVHWVGADLYWMRKFPYEDLKNLGGALRMSATHLTENAWAQKELKDLLGIESDIVPIPPMNTYEVKPLPKEFSVAAFFTKKSDFDKYYQEHTLSLIRAMPDIQFNGYGDGLDNVQYHNLKNFGNLSKDAWKEFVYNNSCLMRFARHDTRALASDEFMLAGRDVISNIPGGCTDYIDTSGKSEINKWDNFQPGFLATDWSGTKKKIIQKIREIKRRTVSLEEREKIRASRYVGMDEYKSKIYELCDVKYVSK